MSAPRTTTTGATATALAAALLAAAGGAPAAAQEATPTPTPTAAATPRLELDATSSSAGAPVRVTVRLAESLRGEVRLLAYSRPSTQLRVIRTGAVEAEGGEISWEVRPTSSTRFVAEGPGGTSDPVVLPVAPQLTAALDDELACGTVRGRVLPAAAGRSVRVRLTVDGEERVGYRAVDAAGRFVVRHCPADGLAREVVTVVEVRNGVTWAPQQVAFAQQRTVH